MVGLDPIDAGSNPAPGTMHTPQQHAEYALRRYHRLRAQWIAELGGRCKCGSTRKLQLDHVDPKTKTMEIGELWSAAIVRVREELKKCQVLCAKCHKRKTADEMRKGHGTWGMYRNRKCRCAECRALMREYKRKRRREAGVPVRLHSGIV